MSYFEYQNDTLSAEGVALDTLAREYGTPLYVYSRAALTDAFQAYQQTALEKADPAMPPLVCFAVKSNSNLAVLKIMSELGAGFDIVSGGELARVIAAGGDPDKVIFSGVGKTVAEIRYAIEKKIFCFNVESVAELHRLNDIAGELGVKAPLAFRVNPNISIDSHPYISTGLKESKFGVAYESIISSYETAASLPNIQIKGIACHIGSQMLNDEPLLDALDRLTTLFDELAQKGIELEHVDIGGGLGIAYNNETPVPIADYVSRLFERISKWRAKNHNGMPVKVIIEPGRSISGPAGVLLGEVQYLKSNGEKDFVVVDAAMNDLMRPTLYDAWHTVLPVRQKAAEGKAFDIVGPICESGDWLAKNRQLDPVEGDLLAFMTAGAYGMVMASNYNTRPRAAEVVVDKGQAHLVRTRETVADLFTLENTLP